jgi:hypothetical protein
MGHPFHFARLGGVDQVVLRDGADLAALRGLDQKLWLALTCPVRGLELEPATLKLLDRDGDGRVHADDLLDAIDWLAARLRSLDALLAGAAALPLTALRAEGPGEALGGAARMMLEQLDKGAADALTVADADAAAAGLAARPANGDGVVPPAALDDPALAALATEICACAAPAIDRSGAPGVSAATVEAFWGELQARASWLDGEDEACRPLGDRSAAAWAALRAVQAKVDDYFARCRVAAYDARAGALVNREEGAYAPILAGALDADAGALVDFPLAHVAPGQPLPLDQGVNPAWAGPLRALRAEVVEPLLGPRAALEEADWRALRERFTARAAWLAAEAGASVAALGADRVRALLAGDLRAKLEEAIARDAALADQAGLVDDVVKLARLHRDLIVLLHNFVSFRDFYDPARWAVFQAGTLYLDQRACQLVLPVLDTAKHAAMAAKSQAFLAYCDCFDGAGGKRSICAVITGGEVDNLAVGRNGLFYDREGKPWAATVTRVVSNPVSVRAAFFAPYKKALAFVEEQVEKRAAAAEKQADGQLSAGLAKADAAATAGAPAAPPAAPAKPKVDVGVVAAIGVAVGGLVAALGAVFNALFGLGAWMPVGVLALVLAISLPSVAVAWLKLRRRNLGPLLDANGWAVNAMARVNVPLGEALTPLARLPEGATRQLDDPFAERKRGRWLALAAALLLLAGGLWAGGLLDELLPRSWRARTVLHAEAPAAKP